MGLIREVFGCMRVGDIQEAFDVHPCILADWLVFSGQLPSGDGLLRIEPQIFSNIQFVFWNQENITVAVDFREWHHPIQQRKGDEAGEIR